MISFEKELPEVNLTSNLLILESAKDSLKNDWLNFCDDFICNELKQSNPYAKKREIREYIPGSNSFLNFNQKLKNIFGLSDTFRVIDFEFNNGIFSTKIKIDYDGLLYLLNNTSNTKISNIYFSIKSVLLRFLIFQRLNKKLLFPINFKQLEYMKYNYSLKYNAFEMYNKFTKFMHSNQNSIKYINDEIKAFNIILCCCNWLNIDTIKNIDINEFHRFCAKNKKNIRSFERKNSVLNKLRSWLISNGRFDIDNSISFINSGRKNTQSNFYDMQDDPFSWLTIEKDHKLFQLKTDANLYLKRLCSDGLSLATRKKYMVSINHYFRYILLKQDTELIFSESSVNKSFDINNKENFLKYLEVENLAKGTIHASLSHINKLLEFSGLMTTFARRNIPRKENKRRRITPRDAMPQELLEKLREMIINNPPKSGTLWDSSKADISWWKHKDIYPVQPLMLLMHLNIPIRGGQLRHLCREKSLVFDEKGNLTRFVINTDKNVHRDSLQEIPNVWPELNILQDYLRWNKEYFPLLPKYKYNGEDNTPWEDIEPLFLIPNTHYPITAFKYKTYLKRLLCKYQIEMNEKVKDGENSFLQKVAWFKNSNKFFNSIEELDNATESFINSEVLVAYNIHAIRVTGITRYLHAGVNLNVLLMLTGHVDYNMIVNVYTKFTHEEKRNILKSAVDKLRFDEPENLLSNVEKFLFDEIPNRYDTLNQKDIKRAFKENGLFSLKRNATSLYENALDMSSGIELASLKHPSTWFPMISGICPGVQCPEGRERKCSLCSYFITGKIFLDGIIHMANMKMAEFFRLSKEYSFEKNVSKNYGDTRRTTLELLVEEIIGWHQIIEKIEKEISSTKNMLIEKSNDINSSIAFEEKPSEIAYLENCYNAKLMGVEQDNYGLKILTIKAIKFANSINKEEDISKIINSEEIAIDYLMNYYLEYKNKNLLPSFIEKIK